MPIFRLTLQVTYFRQGFFNVTVDYDRYIRKTDGQVRIFLGRNGQEITAKVNRRVNSNGTARVLGGTALRDWFQDNFSPMDVVAVDLTKQDVIVLERPR